MNNQNIELSLRVNGNSVAEYVKDGRHFVEGKVGSSYSLRIKNNNGYRIKVVPSVDGVSVLSGKPATGSSTEAGYILGAYESTTIDGYRLDNDTCAAFKFTEAAGGYAKQEKKMEGTTGVIGVRVWREKEAPPPAPSPIIVEKHIHHHDEYRYWRDWNNCPIITWQSPWYGTCNSSYSISLNANASDGLNSQTVYALNCSATPTISSSRSVETQKCAATVEQPFNLGSTFGAKVQSKVKEVTFEVGHLVAELSLFYATRNGLLALGVDLSRADKVVFPQAFGNYCKPPSGWTG